MLKSFVLFGSLALSFQSFACTVNTGDMLSEAVRQEIIVLCEQKKAEALKAAAMAPDTVTKSIESIDKESIDKITAVSQAIVKVVTETARGLGVEVNNFIQSPAGIFLSVIFTLYMFGSQILVVLLFLFVVFALRWYLTFLYNRYSFESQTSTFVPRLWGLYTVEKVTINRTPFDKWSNSNQNEYKSATGVCFAVFCIIVAIVMIILVV
jgi:Flp pilus assembly protein TadB